MAKLNLNLNFLATFACLSTDFINIYIEREICHFFSVSLSNWNIYSKTKLDYSPHYLLVVDDEDDDDDSALRDSKNVFFFFNLKYKN